MHSILATDHTRGNWPFPPPPVKFFTGRLLRHFSSDALLKRSSDTSASHNEFSAKRVLAANRSATPVGRPDAAFAQLIALQDKGVPISALCRSLSAGAGVGAGLSASAGLSEDVGAAVRAGTTQTQSLSGPIASEPLPVEQWAPQQAISDVASPSFTVSNTLSAKEMIGDVLLVVMWGAMIPGLLWLGHAVGF